MNQDERKTIQIGDEEFEVTSVGSICNTCGYLPEITLSSGASYLIAQSSAEAGEKAREYWEDLAQTDPEEFTAIVGNSVLVSWALGQFSDGPGAISTRSLNEWLDLHLDNPADTWATYDGEEVKGRINQALADELGFDELACVCYLTRKGDD